MTISEFMDCKNCNFYGKNKCIKFGLTLNEIDLKKYPIYFNSVTLKKFPDLPSNIIFSKNNVCPFSIKY